MDVRSELYSLSPIRFDSQRILQSLRKQPRYVNKVPFKVLDAPELADDFYLNLVDWGTSNILGVGLSSSVYMWNSMNGHVTKLCQLKDDIVTSVSWIQRVSIHIFLILVILINADCLRLGNPSLYWHWQGLRPDLGC